MNNNNNNKSDKPERASGKGGKKTNKQREDARSAFDVEATKGELVKLDNAFGGFTEDSRNNIDLYFSTTLDDRLANGYVQQSREYSRTVRQDAAEEKDLGHDTQFMVTASVARVLFDKHPNSKKKDVSMWSHIKEEMFTTPNLRAVLSNLGKFEFEQYVARFRYGSQDIQRLIFKLLKDYSGRKGFGSYAGPTIVLGRKRNAPVTTNPSWDTVDPNSVIFPNDDSTLWLVDQSKTFLASVFDQNFEIPMADGKKFYFSYPRFKMDGNRDERVKQISTWLKMLDPAVHPDVFTVVAAALMTVWTTSISRNYLVNMSDHLDIELPDWIDVYPPDILAAHKVFLSVPSGDQAPNGAVDMFEDALNFVLSKKPVFDRFLNMVSMPTEVHGSVAQLIALPQNQMTRFVDPDTDFSFYRIKNDAKAEVFFKVPDHGLVVLGMIAGFTSKVEVRPNFSTSLLRSPSGLLSTTLMSDFKKLV